MIAQFDDAPGVGRDIRVVRAGYKLDGAMPAVDAPPPTLGQHTDALLREAGYDDNEIRALHEEQAL
jgi:formyl-CoA transferase